MGRGVERGSRAIEIVSQWMVKLNDWWTNPYIDWIFIDLARLETI